MAGVDVHQHLWPAAFVDALRARRDPPRLSGWTLHLAGEPAYRVRPAEHDPRRRAALDADRDRVLVAFSSPLGIEYLPPEQAEPLLSTWHDGVRELPAPFAGWASVNQVEPDVDELKRLLQDGFVGLQVPATELATPAALERVAPVLAVAEAVDRPVLVHPAPLPDRATFSRRTRHEVARSTGMPPWWPATVGYVGQLHAAWWAWYAAGRALLPRLRICFVAGAGLAPLHHERFAARGGGPLRLDERVFVDTSSYGRQGLDALVRVLGVDALVLGSDRPYAEPTDPHLGPAATRAIRITNPKNLLYGATP